MAGIKGKSGVYKRTNYHKEINRKSHLGQHSSPETEFKKGQVSLMKGREHTKESKKKMSLFRLGKFTGKNSPNWIDGRTPENARIRNSIEFRLWREAVFARDNWICQKCKIKGGTLHPHHIKNFAQYKELRFAIDNGITFCQECHREFHKKYGIKNNNQEQINKFLWIH